LTSNPVTTEVFRSVGSTTPQAGIQSETSAAFKYLYVVYVILMFNFLFVSMFVAFAE
jgi:hypothetical protein